MTYEVEFKPSGDRDIGKLSADVRQRVLEKATSLANSPRPPGVKPLKGRRRGLWRLRVGEYRIVYHIDDRAGVVSIVAVGPRGSVYS